jgi:hypothetical protein
MQSLSSPKTPVEPVQDGRSPEARYAYYRRCQVFRKSGAQCKAPAEKGSHICHAHAGQLAMAVRRERERRAVLAEAVAQMRKRGKPECEMADLFMDFKGINVTLAVTAQAVIDGRIDCKTAGRLVVHLQTVSKLLWMIHREGRKGRKERQISPQICADERRLDQPEEKTNLTTETRRHGEQQKPLPRINTDDTDLGKPGKEQHLTTELPRHREQLRAKTNWAANGRETMRIAFVGKVRALMERPGWAHAPPELLRAA